MDQFQRPCNDHANYSVRNRSETNRAKTGMISWFLKNSNYVNTLTLLNLKGDDVLRNMQPCFKRMISIPSPLSKTGFKSGKSSLQTRRVPCDLQGAFLWSRGFSNNRAACYITCERALESKCTYNLYDLYFWFSFLSYRHTRLLLFIATEASVYFKRSMSNLLTYK